MKSPVNHPIDIEVRKALSELDPVIGHIIKERGEISIPVFDDHFYSLVMSIIYQQLSYKAATTIFNRLLEQVGHDIRPETLEGMSVEEFRKLGISGQKAKYIHDICRHFCAFPERYGQLHEYDDEAAIKFLCDIKGVGLWTAQMFLMFTLLRPDVFPVGDLGIRKAMSALYDLPIDAPYAEFETLAKQWAPYRSFACHYLWHMHDQ